MTEEEKGKLKTKRPEKAHWKKDKGGVKQLLVQKKFKKWRIYGPWGTRQPNMKNHGQWCL
jgi:hypothetical protein